MQPSDCQKPRIVESKDRLMMLSCNHSVRLGKNPMRVILVEGVGGIGCECGLSPPTRIVITVYDQIKQRNLSTFQITVAISDIKQLAPVKSQHISDDIFYSDGICFVKRNGGAES